MKVALMAAGYGIAIAITITIAISSWSVLGAEG